MRAKKIIFWPKRTKSVLYFSRYSQKTYILTWLSWITLWWNCAYYSYVTLCQKLRESSERTKRKTSNRHTVERTWLNLRPTSPRRWIQKSWVLFHFFYTDHSSGQPPVGQFRSSSGQRLSEGENNLCDIKQK